MSEQWLSINEYSRVFSISDMTVRRRIRTGRLSAVLRDGKYYIHVLDGHDPFGDVNGQQLHPVNKIAANPTKNPVRSTEFTVQNTGSRSNGASGGSNSAHEFRHVPARIAAQISTKTEVSVNGSELLSFCEEALRKFADFERRIVAENHSKIHAIQQELNSKNLEIKQLKQQVEDLQVLVSLMESRR